MYISRIVIRNFRNFSLLDIPIADGVTCVVGENNTGKSNLIHALRLAIDSNLSSRHRRLEEHDVYSGVTIASPEQVLVSVELSDFRDKDNECAMVGTWTVDDDDSIARITYRFRPNSRARDRIQAEKDAGASEPTVPLSMEDYHWELTGGGNIDPAVVCWDEDMGRSVSFSDLQAYQVVPLPAWRDVRLDSVARAQSPLTQLFCSSEIAPDEKENLVAVLRKANEDLAASPTIKALGEAIEGNLANTAGEAFAMGLRLGMVDPAFAAIQQAVTVLLTDKSLKDYDLARNGLGLNNIIYISILLEYFDRRVNKADTAGQLLLVEEPEAHLHPQLQRTLYSALSSRPVQTILTTHSTHITSQTPLERIVALGNGEKGASSATVPRRASALAEREAADLERYLDATRSSLFYARKVMLVEGPAELFLIPPLVKAVLKTDLDRQGISIIPIFGVHFQAYAHLFGEDGLARKCAIVADGDLSPSDCTVDALDGEEEEAPAPENDLSSLNSEYVQVFQSKTTFEREVTFFSNLGFLIPGVEESGKAKTAKKLKAMKKTYDAGISKEEATALRREARDLILNVAKAVGKARFAQIASKHAHLARQLPDYLTGAVTWLLKA